MGTDVLVSFSAAAFDEVFRAFDEDGSGTIEKDEMGLFIKRLWGEQGDSNDFAPGHGRKSGAESKRRSKSGLE